MSIELEVFKKYKLNKRKLRLHGFKEENGKWTICENFMDNQFRAEIIVDNIGKISGKVIEVELGEEYTNFRIEGAMGEFVNTVREEYVKLLEKIAQNCFDKQEFLFEQTNRITHLINQEYKVEPEFLWDKFPGYGVFRNKRSQKWFGIIMNVEKSKIIPNEQGEIEILNIKLDDVTEKKLIKKGIYPSYHLNKKNWITIILDDSLKDETIMELIRTSYNISDIKGEWIVPANPKYYDVINAFNDKKIINWKQSNNILIGDIVYLYVASPYSAILFKCEAIETDIPYEHSHDGLTIKKVMKIKLLKRYSPDEITFNKLNEFGIRVIRGPRGVPKALSEELNK